MGGDEKRGERHESPQVGIYFTLLCSVTTPR